MIRLSLRIPVLAVVLALVACGSDDGAGGSSGSGGAAGAAGSSGSGGSTVQPAKMVQLPAGFWIDSTEVTRAQYAAWLETNPATTDQLPECGWNDNFTPAGEWPPGDKPDHPVVGVDWCDAYAYCLGVGKRLCGRIGGGAGVLEDRDDATKSQWYYACSSGGLYEYPYGNEYDPDACNLEDSGLSDTAPAASFPTCQSSESGFEGIFDMCGNVREWVDACADSVGPDDGCSKHDGAFLSSSVPSRCRSASSSPRNERAGSLGFRCCRD